MIAIFEEILALSKLLTKSLMIEPKSAAMQLQKYAESELKRAQGQRFAYIFRCTLWQIQAGMALHSSIHEIWIDNTKKHSIAFAKSCAESELKRAQGQCFAYIFRCTLWQIQAGMDLHSSIHEIWIGNTKKHSIAFAMLCFFVLVTRSRIELLLPP